MSQNLIHVGMDVDDVRYHGSALDRETAEMLDFRKHSRDKWPFRQSPG